VAALIGLDDHHHVLEVIGLAALVLGLPTLSFSLAASWGRSASGGVDDGSSSSNTG
jgi:hypothetical protein